MYNHKRKEQISRFLTKYLLSKNKFAALKMNLLQCHISAFPSQLLMMDDLSIMKRKRSQEILFKTISLFTKKKSFIPCQIGRLLKKNV